MVSGSNAKKNNGKQTIIFERFMDRLYSIWARVSYENTQKLGRMRAQTNLFRLHDL